jgi:predicted ATPase
MGEGYGFRTTVHYFRGEFDAAKTWAERAIQICEESGFVVWLAHARVMYGRVLAELGDAEAGVKEMRRGYQMWSQSGAVVTRPFYLAMQAEGLALAGRPTEAFGVLDHALELIEAHGERYYEAEIRRLYGKLLSDQDSSDDGAAEAEKWLLNALEVAQSRKLRSLALRTATSLAVLWLRTGRKGDAYRILERAAQAISEGSGTADLRHARRVLEEAAKGAVLQR